MFRSDINSCTLPKPPLLSLGPDVARGHASSGGVIYMNTTAYTDTFSDFMEHAHVHGYSTESVALDQAMLKRYLQGFTTLLPDLFNYKPYWGAPQPVTGLPSGEPVIIHMQGPKPYRAVCALKDFKEQNPTPEQLKAHDWPGRSETLKACKLDNPHHVYLPWDIEEAYMIDSGDMYFEVLKEYEGHRGAIGNGHS